MSAVQVGRGPVGKIEQRSREAERSLLERGRRVFAVGRFIARRPALHKPAVDGVLVACGGRARRWVSGSTGGHSLWTQRMVVWSRWS